MRKTKVTPRKRRTHSRRMSVHKKAHILVGRVTEDLESVFHTQ